MLKWLRMSTPLLNADPGAAGGAAPATTDPNGQGGQQQQQPGKTFTQEEVDAMMNQRWKDTEMTKTELNELTELVKQFGYEGATPAEVKAQIKAELQQRQKAQELQQLQQQAKDTGTSPELLAEMNELKKELAAIKQEKERREQAVQQQQAAEQAWNQQVSTMQTKHPEVDMEKLAQDQKFIRFLSKANPAIPLHEVYEEFVDLVGGAESAAVAKLKANLDRSTSSGRGGGDPTGGTFGLNDNQIRLAKQNGMTPKEYAELLGHIRK